MSRPSPSNGEDKGPADNTPNPEKVWILGRIPVDADILESELKRGRINAHDEALIIERTPPGPMYTPYYCLALFALAPLIYGRFLVRRRWSTRGTIGAVLFGAGTGFTFGWVSEAGAVFLPMLDLLNKEDVSDAMDTMIAEQARRQEEQKSDGPVFIPPPIPKPAIKQSPDTVNARSSAQQEGYMRWYDKVKGYFGGKGGGNESQ